MPSIVCPSNVQFLIGVAQKEGQLPPSLPWTSFVPFAADKFPRRELTEPARAALAKRDGRAVSSIREEIGQRRPGYRREAPRQPDEPPPDHQPPPSHQRGDTDEDF